MKTQITCIDLFSGAGGLSEGFTNDNYNIVAHIEKDSDACLTLKTRLSYHHLKKKNKLHIYYEYLKGHISREDLYSEIPEDIINSVINEEISDKTFKQITETIDKRLAGKDIDLVFGGPPCQAFSLVGRSRDKDRMVKDERKYLYLQYIKFLKKYKPKYFVFENVKGLLSSRDENGELVLDKMEKDFMKSGYSFEYKILNSSHFGVSQKRERIIIFGFQSNLNFTYPTFEKITPLKIKELFSDLPKIPSNSSSREYKNNDCLVSKYRNQNDILTQHNSRYNNQNDLEIYKIAVSLKNKGERLKYNNLPDRLITHKNLSSFTDRFKVINENDLSHTVVAHIAKDGHYYIHPDINQNRSITVREAARIQSFDDNYYFEQSRTAAFRQIGNAVPPAMAKEISKKILELF